MGFLDQYFLEPIAANGWFNPVNTVVYAIGLIVGVWLVYKLLLRMRIPIDRKFGYAVLPFIFWGSSTRVLHDAAVAGALPPGLLEFYSQPFFPTPGSYFITFGLALAVLLASLLVQRATARHSGLRQGGIPYWKTMLGIGVVLDLVNVLLLPLRNWLPFAAVVSVWAVWSLLFIAVGRIATRPWFTRCSQFFRIAFSPVNLAILSAHFLDASATYFALKHFGYLEQHFLPRSLFGISDPLSFFILKIVVVLPVLLIIDRETTRQGSSPGSAPGGPFRSLLKLVILILGAAPGLRDLLRLAAGV